MAAKRKLREFKWKTTKIIHPTAGEVEVTHWHSQHKIRESLSPQEIVDLLGEEHLSANPATVFPTKKSGAFRPFQKPLAVPKINRLFFLRSYPVLTKDFDTVFKRLYAPNPNEVFSYLQELLDKRVSVVELPIAKVVTPDRTILITLWKKKTVTLGEFLTSRNKKITDEMKSEAVLSAAKNLAKLHAAGFIHHHPHLENFVVVSALKGKSASLIDPKFLHRLPNDVLASKKLMDEDLNFFMHRASGYCYTEDVLSAYNKQFETTIKRLASLSKN